MPLLTYSVIADAVPLEASSATTVYLLVSNQHDAPTAGRTTGTVYWSTIEVDVPTGTTSSDLTSDATTINPTLQPQGTQPATFTGQDLGNVYRATARSNGQPLKPGDFMVLALQNVVVNPGDGLAVLTVHERAALGRTAQRVRTAVQGLVKKAPKAPHNFRPKQSMVDNGDSIVLKWDGPSDLQYWIQFWDGSRQQVGGTGQWSPAPGTGPNRDTTYTLVARSGGQDKYFLTTTVHLRNPTFETLTATTGTSTPWIRGTGNNNSRVIFSPLGVDIHKAAGGGGTIAAAEAVVSGVRTGWVQGSNSDDGWISFPKSGLNVYRDGQSVWGTVAADQLNINNLSLNRAEVNGWLTVNGGLKVINERGKVLLETGENWDGMTISESCSFQSSATFDGDISVKLVQGYGYVMATNEAGVHVQGYVTATKSVLVESDPEWSRSRGGLGRRV